MKKIELPLRIGVGIILLNSENKVFVGKRRDNPIDKWQMPQGGVDQNEEYLDAMKRELFEETGVKSIEIIKELNNWYTYELPKKLVGVVWKGKFRGQKQKWYLVKFIGNDSEIDLNTGKPEFIEWKWVEIDELTNLIVDFKKNIYEKLSIEIKKFI
tara:strand:- start:531 stop:998 length:468 start_codon:yes stop_codon:yes gene_type:complete